MSTNQHVHHLDPLVVDQKLPVGEIVWFSFLHVYHQDHANAAMHTAPVRYSPITFRTAEWLWNNTPSYQQNEWVRSVILDSGLYEEDMGR